MMAFITVKPEIKNNLSRVARELKIDEELLRRANRTAQEHQLYCPGYVIEEHSGKEIETIQDIKRFYSLGSWTFQITGLTKRKSTMIQLLKRK